MTRLFVALIASFVAASCAAVRTNVAVSHMLSASGSGKTVAIMPYTPALSTAPDFGANTAKLAAQLRAKGYTVVAATGGPAPDYLAFFVYRIDGGTEVNPLAGSAQPFVGSIISYGYRTMYNRATHRIYMRSVTVDILDRARFQPNQPASYVTARVYSGSVTSDGPCSTMAMVIDPMLMALFADFPGQSGRLQTIDVPADTTCGLDRFG